MTHGRAGDPSETLKRLLKGLSPSVKLLDEQPRDVIQVGGQMGSRTTLKPTGYSLLLGRG